jgi:hypothetical protein
MLEFTLLVGSSDNYNIMEMSYVQSMESLFIPLVVDQPVSGLVYCCTPKCSSYASEWTFIFA